MLSSVTRVELEQEVHRLLACTEKFQLLSHMESCSYVLICGYMGMPALLFSVTVCNIALCESSSYCGVDNNVII